MPIKNAAFQALAFGVLSLPLLTACGETTGDRALSGGGIGAGTGAVLGAATGGNPLTGALIGGGVGAVAGAVTSPDTVNLGEPIWR
jgi:osmotically inducible lipoprotein OsmB